MTKLITKLNLTLKHLISNGGTLNGLRKLMVLIGALAVGMVACRYDHHTSHQKIPAKWFGNWVVKPFFDSIAYTDTNYSGRCCTLNISQYGFTEIIINKSLGDSILILNEDVEESYSTLRYLSEDTLVTADSLYFIFDNTNNTIYTRIDKRYPVTAYFKAPANMLDDYSMEQPAIKTAFRKMFNTEFNRYSYLLYDSLNARDERKYVTMFANGKIMGYKKYSKYYMNLNGDLNNVEDAVSVTLYTNEGNESFGLKYYVDSLELYTLRLLTQEGEKPNYRTEKKVATLVKHRWE